MGLHADATARLHRWSAPTPAQDRLRRRYLDLLADEQLAPYRSSFPDHLTCGALVLDHTGNRVLLNLHRKANRWFHFGGHCEDDDPTLLAAATRELREESGLSGVEVDPDIAQLDVHPVPFCDPRGTVHHLDVRFVARAHPDAEHRASAESLDVRWFGLDELPELEPAMHDLIALARGRFVG